MVGFFLFATPNEPITTKILSRQPRLASHPPTPHRTSPTATSFPKKNVHSFDILVAQSKILGYVTFE